MPVNSGQTPNADEVMNAFGTSFLDFSQLLFDSKYNGFHPRLANAGVPNLDRVFYSTFEADDADVSFGFLYDSTNDMYETPDLSGVTEYIFIEATSLSAPWNANNCRSLQITSGKWLIYCTTGTDEVHRAQIHKSLWYGTDGTDPLILDFSSVTAVKVSDAADVGFRGYLADLKDPGGSNSGNVVGTFANTTTNTVSSWSNIFGTPSNKFWDVPAGTTLNTSGDELGTDLSADEKTNPADCKLIVNWSGGGGTVGTVEAIIFCKGAITFVFSGSGTNSEVDYFTDNSIPDTTLSGSLSTEGADGTGTLIFKDTASATVTNAIPSINSTIDATSSEQISISADGGGSFTNVNNGEIARATPTGTALWRKMVITRATLDKLDKVTEQAVKFNYY